MKTILSILTTIILVFVVIFSVKAFDKDYYYSVSNSGTSYRDVIKLDKYHGEEFEYNHYHFTYLFKD